MGNAKGGHGSCSCGLGHLLTFLGILLTIAGIAASCALLGDGYLWSIFWWVFGIIGGNWSFAFLIYFISDGNDGYPTDDIY